MRRFRSRAMVAASLPSIVLCASAALGAPDRAWHWTYVTRTPNDPQLTAQSTLSLSGQAVRMTYTIPLQQRQVVIESCNGELRDIDGASTIRSQGTTYLLIHFKFGRTATCVSGARPAVALPADDAQYVSRIAAALNAACCTVARVAPASPTPSPAHRPSPSPAPSPTRSAAPRPTPTTRPSPTATPTATPTAAPTVVRDWVESDGVFRFVRVHNRGRAPIVLVGEVFDCRGVDLGCGPFERITIDPGATATVATIAASRDASPDFRYRYTAADGARTLAGEGSAEKDVPHGTPRMSAQELRRAQTATLAQFASPHPDTDTDTIVPPKLLKRGSSRLAIGERGTAVLRVMLSENGTPADVEIVSISNRALTAAALETAVSSTYAPAEQNGRPVPAKYIATFSFDGTDPALSDVPVWKRPATPSPTVTPSPSPTLATPVPPSAPGPGAPPTPPAPLAPPTAHPR